MAPVSMHGKNINPGDTPLLLSPAGRVVVAPLSSSAYGDANGAGTFGLNRDADNTGLLSGVDFLFNGTTYDRARNNHAVTALASAERTASVNSADQVNFNHRGLVLVIDVTAITATPSITVTIRGKDPLSGKYYTILASAAIAAVSTTILRVYPGLTAAANTVASDVLPRNWRVEVVHADADSITYSIAGLMIP